MSKTTTQSQVTFKTDTLLKEKALTKARREGITLKAFLTMAMREYLNNNITLGLRSDGDYFDPVFADPDVIKRANELGELIYNMWVDKITQNDKSKILPYFMKHRLKELTEKLGDF